MITADGWAFLNVANPICAWATYRGVLVSVPPDAGMISVWSASQLKAANPSQLRREAMLEQVRSQFYPGKVSRLKGMFCFDDLASAEKALAWGSHFRTSNLAELSFAEVTRRDRFDSNWITHFRLQSPDEPALFAYWSGQPCPNFDPIWETLVEGRLIVLGVEIRERAYALIERHMPESTAILEAGRVAAWVGSNLGSTSAFLLNDNDYISLVYLMDMKDAHDPDFLQRLALAGEQGHPMRAEAVAAFQNDTVRLPDLRPFGFRRLKTEFPFVTIKAAPADNAISEVAKP